MSYIINNVISVTFRVGPLHGNLIYDLVCYMSEMSARVELNLPLLALFYVVRWVLYFCVQLI